MNCSHEPPRVGFVRRPWKAVSASCGRRGRRKLRRTSGTFETDNSVAQTRGAYETREGHATNH
jgi:hypothetical protein